MKKMMWIFFLLAATSLTVSSCASKKECSRKGKTKVPMGHM